LFPETLHLFVSPNAVLALSRSGWRRRLVRSHCYAVAAPSREPWNEVLLSVTTALSDFGCRRLRVVMSHHFVQYHVLPWREDLQGNAEYLALAQLEFSAIFGALADTWTLAINDDSPGRSRLAAGMPVSLLEGLRTATTHAGVKLMSAQPYLTVMAQLWLKEALSKTACNWILLHEPGRVCLAARQAGAWRWVRHVRVGDDWIEQIEQILHSEIQLSGLEATPAQVHVLAPGAGRDALQMLRDAGFQVLEPVAECGFINDTHSVYAPAWLG
jgi:hypothetical protein